MAAINKSLSNAASAASLSLQLTLYLSIWSCKVSKCFLSMSPYVSSSVVLSGGKRPKAHLTASERCHALLYVELYVPQIMLFSQVLTSMDAPIVSFSDCEAVLRQGHTLQLVWRRPKKCSKINLKGLVPICKMFIPSSVRYTNGVEKIAISRKIWNQWKIGRKMKWNCQCTVFTAFSVPSLIVCIPNS